jgi:starch phosphorylase
VEIHERVGDDNIYIFGKSSDEVIRHYANQDYHSGSYYDQSETIRDAVDFITGPQMMAVGNAQQLNRLQQELLHKDWFMTLLDLEDYIQTKERAVQDYTDRRAWAEKMLVNIAEAGFFSADRTIGEYNAEIWKLR